PSGPFHQTDAIEKIKTLYIDSWQCIDCKDCEICGDKGAERELVLCDMCDRGYHTFCLDPPLKKLPQGRFLCLDCAFCVSCGARKPGDDNKAKWQRDYTLCQRCSNQIEKNKFCPICMRAYFEEEDSPMIMCDYCDWWIHVACD